MKNINIIFACAERGRKFFEMLALGGGCSIIELRATGVPAGDNRDACAREEDMKKNLKTVYANCTLVNVKSDCALVKNTDIFVEDGKIVKVAPAGGDRTGWEVYDASGKFAMPGLVNAHAHLFGTGLPSKVISGGGAQKLVLKLVHSPLGMAVLKMLVSSACAQELNSGVTTLRGLGDFRGSDIAVRDALKKGKGKAAGLDLIVSGPAITAPGGHGDGTFALTASTPEEFAALVAQNAENGADLIKICITGGVTDAKKKGEPGEVKMTAEQIKAACDRAHALGKRVAAHIQSPKGVELAALNGVDTVEHGAHMSEEAAAALKARGGAVVATYTPAYPYYKLPPEVTKLDEVRRFNSGIVLDAMTQCVRDAYAHGITVAMGTDASCPFSTQTGMWREVIYFARLGGFGAKAALYAATMGGAAAVVAPEHRAARAFARHVERRHEACDFNGTGSGDPGADGIENVALGLFHHVGGNGFEGRFNDELREDFTFQSHGCAFEGIEWKTDHYRTEIRVRAQSPSHHHRKTARGALFIGKQLFQAPPTF